MARAVRDWNVRTMLHKDPNYARASRYIDFGITDNKGRALGIHFVFSLETYKDITATEMERYGRYAIPVGTYYAVCGTTTRNRREYGATQDRVMYTTEAEVDAYVTARINATRARYLKKFPHNAQEL